MSKAPVNQGVEDNQRRDGKDDVTNQGQPQHVDVQVPEYSRKHVLS